jgi:hypothetical protein
MEQQAKEPSDSDAPTAESADPAEPPADVTFDPATEWRDHFAQTNIPARASAEDEEKRQFMFDSLVAPTSLQETLL